ncbi:MAG: hypothetical protein R3E96_02940 [Planctomycetota bacterium]
MDPLSGPVGRYNFDAGGFQSPGVFDASHTGRTSPRIRFPGAGSGFRWNTPWVVWGGSTVHLQLWYRDGFGMSNLSNGISLTF